MGGQSGKGGDVITMLEFINSESVKEAQADYEDSMTKLKAQEAADEKQLADLQDELAEKEKSLLEAQEDLKATTADKEAVEAIEGIEKGLPSLQQAETARKRPEPPPPASEPTAWVYTWLKSKKLEQYGDAFMGQALEEREDLLAAPLDHKALEDMGIKKMGDRCKILRYIDDAKQSAEAKANKQSKA